MGRIRGQHQRPVPALVSSVCLYISMPLSWVSSVCLYISMPLSLVSSICLYISMPLSLVSSLPLYIAVFDQFSVYISVFDKFSVLGDSGGVVNSLDFCPASLESLGYFYFRCVLSSQWMVVTLTRNLRILHCQL